VTHLANLKRQGKITTWHDRASEVGEEWEAQTKSRLEWAGIILLLARLLRPLIIATTSKCDGRSRHDVGTARVTPILLIPI